MSCNHCNVNYSFFNKESGCANCGLSLCSKCLQQKWKIPSKNNKEFKVCRTCYQKLSKGIENENDNSHLIPPDRFLKRLEKLQNPSSPPITFYKPNAKMVALKTGLSLTDQALVERLEKLKEKPKKPPTDKEIKERLAKLKGVTPEDATTSSNISFSMPDTKTDQEKVDSLLKKYSNLVGIEQTHDDSNNKLEDSDEDDEADSEEEINKITERITSEISLANNSRTSMQETKMTPILDDNAENSSEELPWCILCNEDAKFKCYDCGGDLYCTECNLDVHKNWNITFHRIVPYNKK